MKLNEFVNGNISTDVLHLFDRAVFLFVCLCVSGLFSSTMRELSSISHEGPKWIVLDGDIDPMWIESLNTVMDDNKVEY